MQANNRIALGLDRLLADIDKQCLKWQKFYGVQGDPFYTAKILNSEEFWATIKAFDDLPEILDLAVGYGELYILTERPAKLRYVTENWLSRHHIDYKEIIYSSIKRFDCRIRNIGTMLDSDFEHLSWWPYDGIVPLIWKRV